jgi:putative DNA primase/helicase
MSATTVSAPPAPFFRQYATALQANGYDPIPLPLGQKRPNLLAWPDYKFDTADIDKHASGGVGILAARTPAIDIDVRDSAIAQELDAIVREVLQWPDTISPVRIGLAPKLLRPCQLDGPAFKKRVTQGYRLPGDAADAKPHKVEILGDGQQFVAFNIHPDTQQPYTWTNGDPAKLPHAGLPPLSQAKADEIIKRCGEVLAKYGTPVGRAPAAIRAVDPLLAAHRKAGDTWFEPLPDDQKESEVRAIVSTWTAEQATNRESWFICIRSIADAVERGLDHETGIDIATEFSQRSTGAIDTRDVVASKMFEGGHKSSIYAAAVLARKGGGYKPPPGRVVPPPPTAAPPPPGTPAAIINSAGGHPKAPMVAARAFVRNIYHPSGIEQIYFLQSVFMVYEAGRYVELTKDGLRAQVYPFLEIGAAGDPVKPEHVNNMIDALKAATYLPEDTHVPCWLDAPGIALPDLIVCKNGAFDLVTQEVHPLTPRLFSTISLPVDYLPAAPAPAQWLAFLKSVWPDDQESIDTLQEIFGLLLTGMTKFQKIFLLKGPKRSGKGTMLRTVRKLLGEDNVAAPALSTIAADHGMQCLIGKLAALIGDARISVRSDKMAVVVERLLSISGEDSPNVQRKFLPDWTGRLSIRIVMSSNELPHLDDPSGAMASRFVILVLSESFIGREDLELEAKLEPELPAIFNWAIEGRRRLLERGRFVQPQSGAKLVEQMSELSSTVARFVRECCIVGAAHQVPMADLYKAWREWCITNGQRVTDSALFGRDLSAACKVTETRPRDPKSGKQTRHYSGLALVPATAPTVPPTPSPPKFG